MPFSLNASPAERNYDVENWELLAVVLPLQEWRHRLEGTLVPFLIRTNHKNLSYHRSARRLNSCLARWTLSLSCFNYTLYRPGSGNGKPDAPSTSSPQLTPSHRAQALDHWDCYGLSSSVVDCCVLVFCLFCCACRCAVRGWVSPQWVAYALLKSMLPAARWFCQFNVVYSSC